MGKTSELEKLKLDTQHFCKDHGLTSRVGFLKLAVVVDFWPVLHYRLLKHVVGSKNLFKLILRFLLIAIKPFIEGLSGSRIYIDTEIGGGLLLHQSSGVVIAPGVTIGENCTIFSGACIVYKANYSWSSSPRVGNNVKLMIGCKIVGDVTIGDNVFVGANSVVLKDIPSDSIAVGVPAKILIKTV